MREHRKIAKRYIFSGWFFIDFAATFPLDLLVDSGKSTIYPKLLRLFRLPKLIKLLDLARFNRVRFI